MRNKKSVKITSLGIILPFLFSSGDAIAYKESDLQKLLKTQKKCEKCDLSKADLGSVYLRDANLQGTNLSGANLSGANLSGANLSKTNLGDVWFYKSNLSNANLNYADLRKANLNYANMEGADLSFANLSGANLQGTNLSDIDLRDTNLSDTDLSGANLDGALLPDDIQSEIESRSKKEQEVRKKEQEVRRKEQELKTKHAEIIVLQIFYHFYLMSKFCAETPRDYKHKGSDVRYVSKTFLKSIKERTKIFDNHINNKYFYGFGENKKNAEMNVSNLTLKSLKS